MKKQILLFALIAFTVFGWGARTDVSKEIVGEWEFYKVFFQGEYRPPFSEQLKIFFTFTEDGESRLYYYRTNEDGFCERKGRYFVQGNLLVDKVTWVNRENNIGCGQDPDMRLGQETRTEIALKDGDIYLYLSLKGEPLVYVWRKLLPEAD
jgi:hypothetical protein